MWLTLSRQNILEPVMLESSDHCAGASMGKRENEKYDCGRFDEKPVSPEIYGSLG